jgi:hypothetical protein
MVTTSGRPDPRRGPEMASFGQNDAISLALKIGFVRPI